MSKTRQEADNIVACFAGKQGHDKIRAVRTFCNSDSAFIAWAKKTAFSIAAIRNARLIQQAWRRFGVARSLLITIRAVKAVLGNLLANAELVGAISRAQAVDFLASIGKKSNVNVTAAGAAPAQQELFGGA